MAESEGRIVAISHSRKSMKLCHQCGRMTAGEPLFCNSCGRSYDVKLCPRMHANPRRAEVCSQCGSRELSTPQPRVSTWWKTGELLAQIVFGVVLVYLTLAGFGALIQTPQFQGLVIVFGILVGLLWWLWSLLPEWFQKLIRRSRMHKERSRER
jgi:RNA polymerase subunit RPABC4/transcription elongation factor Spt4